MLTKFVEYWISQLICLANWLLRESYNQLFLMWVKRKNIVSFAIKFTTSGLIVDYATRGKSLFWLVWKTFKLNGFHSDSTRTSHAWSFINIFLENILEKFPTLGTHRFSDVILQEHSVRWLLNVQINIRNLVLTNWNVMGSEYHHYIGRKCFFCKLCLICILLHCNNTNAY